MRTSSEVGIPYVTITQVWIMCTIMPSTTYSMANTRMPFAVVIFTMPAHAGTSVAVLCGIGAAMVPPRIWRGKLLAHHNLMICFQTDGLYRLLIGYSV